MTVALVHDYLTQRGGAERVALLLARHFRDAPLYTSVYHPSGTFPGFRDIDVRPTPINRVGLFRRHHRFALPLYARAFSNLVVDAEVTLCSSSGWAHGARVTGRKVVYCYTPARWLYQADRYLGRPFSSGAVSEDLLRCPARRLSLASSALRILGPSLRRWDRRAAHSADRYVVSSSVVARRVLGTYGIEAEVIPPPPGLGPDGPETAVVDVEPGYFLCVSRLLPYKNVDAVIAAVSRIEGGRLVIVGNGPDHSRLSKYASSGVKFVGCIGDSELRWLYRHTRAVVAASYEDYGLTPLEAASFGRPSVVLREGGFLDTVVEGTTGVFFDRPQSDDIARALGALTSRSWDPDALLRHASSFSETRFVERIQEVISLEDRNAATAEHRGAMSEMALDGVAELS